MLKESEAVTLTDKLHDVIMTLTEVVNVLSKEWSRAGAVIPLSQERYLASQPTTAAAQTTAPTREALSDAAAPASTDQPTQPSSQSDPPTTDASRAVPPSECVHDWMPLFYATPEHYVMKVPGLEWCRRCAALKSYGKTLVPAATPVSSTSQSPASPSSAVPLSEASAPSASSESIDDFDYYARMAQ